MKNLAAVFVALGLVALPRAVWSGAFEEHTSWQHEPRLETAKGISLGKSVIEVSMGYRYLYSDAYFDSDAKIGSAPMKYSMSILDIQGAFGFTENWTLWVDIPIVWSTERDAARARSAEGEMGDSQVGLLYQFFRRNDPTLSMGMGLRWKLPTGNEAAGAKNVNITGTGSTDVELYYIGRSQLLRFLSIDWSGGYNIRFPGTVQYLSDRQSYITNAFLDLGDELFLKVGATAAIEMLAFSLSAEFRYRFPTKVGMPEYRAEILDWTVPKNGNSREQDTFIIYNGANYADWGVHQRLDPTRPLVSNAGYLFTLTPRILFRPFDWLDLDIYARFHLAGKNSIYLTDKDGDNSTFDNFMPMQAIGTKLGNSVIMGEAGANCTVRW